MDEPKEMKKAVQDLKAQTAAEGELADDAAEKVSGGYLRKMNGFNITTKYCPYCQREHEVYQFAGISSDKPQGYICQEQAFTFTVKPSGEVILDNEWYSYQ